MTEQQDVPAATLARVGKAWKCVVQTYLTKAKHDSLEKGEGMSMFKFLRPRESTKYNCHYFYIQRSSEAWTEVLKQSPQGKEILKKYSPGMLIVSVTVPVHEIGEDDITSVKLFGEDMKEIDLE